MRQIYTLSAILQKSNMNERRDAVKRQFVTVVRVEAILRRGGNGLHGNRRLQLGFKCPYGYYMSENDVMGN